MGLDIDGFYDGAVDRDVVHPFGPVLIAFEFLLCEGEDRRGAVLERVFVCVVENFKYYIAKSGVLVRTFVYYVDDCHFQLSLNLLLVGVK